jgi:hypothetical protein
MTKSKTFYYCSTLKLSEGSVIEKGSHPLDDVGVPFFKNNYLMVFYEILLENVRLKKFNNKPSRISSLFVAPSLEGLNYFCKQYRQNWPIYRYEVQAVNDHYNYHIGSLDYDFYIKQKYKSESVDKVIQQILFKDFEKMAEIYWLGQSRTDEEREIVIDSPIKILNKI